MLYFAYGINMNDEEMLKNSPHAEYAGTAELESYKFIINRRGAATIIPSSRNRVYGVLWEVSPEEVKSIDGHEGLRRSACRLISVRVINSSGQRSEAFTYIAADSEPSSKLRKDYLEQVIRAARYNELPDKYIKKLEVLLTEKAAKDTNGKKSKAGRSKIGADKESVSITKAAPEPEIGAGSLTMKALAVRQPWATLIAEGSKTIEMRSWKTKYRGQLLICASSKPDIRLDPPDKYPLSSAVCVVDLTDCQPMTKEMAAAAIFEIGTDESVGDPLYGYYGWTLSNPRIVNPLFPVKGKLHLFEVEIPEGTEFISAEEYFRGKDGQADNN